jgi:hypothetical protein
MNLISDLESELALAVLIEKKHSEKINSEEILPLIKRLNAALESVSPQTDKSRTIQLTGKQITNTSH